MDVEVVVYYHYHVEQVFEGLEANTIKTFFITTFTPRLLIVVQLSIASNENLGTISSE